MDRSAIRHRILATGRHDALFADAPGASGLPADVRLAGVQQDDSPDVIASRLVVALAPILAANPPGVLLLLGDPPPRSPAMAGHTDPLY
jgi:hypothetical protein